MPSLHRRGPWVQEEDNALLLLVRSQGPNNWVRISQHMHYRSPKQCRERYHQNLKPSLNHDPITAEEGVLIDRMVKEMGKRWAEIARRLGHRSDNAVKNWWNGSMNRRRRLHNQHNEQSSRPRYNGPQEPLSYTRPTASVTSLDISQQRRHIEAPLVSPSVSEASAHDSLVESAPSLVADTASHTTSPNAHSPSFEFHLPPPVEQRPEDRRPSLPIIHLCSSFYTHDEAQALSALSASIALESKTAQTPNGPEIRPELVLGEPARFTRHQPSQSLPQLSLPSLHSVMHEPEQPQQWAPSLPLSSPPQWHMPHPPAYPEYSSQSSPAAHSPSRDTRMTVSNLMC
jgi:Myb-like DNA-binding protein FlbD